MSEKRFIAVIKFDSITNFSEFQQIIMDLLSRGFTVTIEKEPHYHGETVKPDYADWQMIITKE